MAAGGGARVGRRRSPALSPGAELAYGAFDFAEDADGVWWFLECNQSGQFGFVEMDTGQPIAATIAEWLAGDGLSADGCTNAATGAGC